MKTKILNGFTAAMIVFSMAAIADEGTRRMGGMMMQPGGGMPMMDMDAMRGQMSRTQKTMDLIHGTHDMQARQKLMRRHMDEMYQGMDMMRGMMSGKMEGDQTQRQMLQRMDIMQEMMGQMMEHMRQQERMGMGGK